MKITIITTGGTISKTYNEYSQVLSNERPQIEFIVKTLRLPDLEIEYHHLFDKDSLHMDDADRQFILEAVSAAAQSAEAVVIIHGTDTLENTGEYLATKLAPVSLPIVLTGAMKPYEMRTSDAKQNVIEALLTCRLSKPGVYVAMHNRVLKFPGVIKDRDNLAFCRAQ